MFFLFTRKMLKLFQLILFVFLLLVLFINVHSYQIDVTVREDGAVVDEEVFHVVEDDDAPFESGAQGGNTEASIGKHFNLQLFFNWIF